MNTHLGITHECLVELAQKYGQLLSNTGAHPVKINYQQLVDCTTAEGRQVMLDHAYWICDKLPMVWSNPGGQQIAVRWLGCVQGIIASYGLVTVGQTREDVGLLNTIGDEWR